MSLPTKTPTPESGPTPEQPLPGSPGYEAEIRRWVEYDPARSHRLVRMLTRPLIRYGYRQRAYGIENVPVADAFLMAASHASFMDPFLYTIPQPRILRFMSKSTLLDAPIAGRVSKGLGGFPVRRGQGDTFAIDLAQRLLEDGQAVCIFPEGTRYRESSALGPARSGVAILAIKTGAPVVPAASWGSKPAATRGERDFPFGMPRLTTLYGPSLQFTNVDLNRAEIERVRDEIWAEVHRLHTLAEEIHKLRPRKFLVPGRP